MNDEQYNVRAQPELCESRGGRPGLPVPNKPDGFCGRKATRNLVSPDVFVLYVFRPLTYEAPTTGRPRGPGGRFLGVVSQ